MYNTPPMDEFRTFMTLLICFALGASIGLEREINEKRPDSAGKKKIGLLGLRTFSLVCGLGGIVGTMVRLQPGIALLVGSIFGALLLIFYYFDSLKSKDIGITTEIALLYCFVLGVNITLGILPIQMLLAVTVILVLLLSRKGTIKGFISTINREELNAFISFSILAGVILPFLPDTSYTFENLTHSWIPFKQLSPIFQKLLKVELLNPFKIWFFVVLMTGVDLGGYVLEGLVGKTKGWLFTSLAGGFVSSTATTVTLAKKSKETKTVERLVASAVFANFMSFFPLLFLIATLNGEFFLKILPVLLILMLSLVLSGFYFLLKKVKSDKSIIAGHVVKTKLFNIESALKFAGIFLLINITSRVALALFGTGGFLISAALGALTGVDALVITISQVAGTRLDFRTAILAFLIVNAVNLLSKSVYSLLQGNRKFAIQFGISMLISVIVSFISLIWVL